MSTSGSKPPKQSNVRKRTKVQCIECGLQFDDDYKSRHEKKAHRGKPVRIKHVGAPANPFEAASSSKKRKVDTLAVEPSIRNPVSVSCTTKDTGTIHFSSPPSSLHTELPKLRESQPLPSPTKNLISIEEPEIVKQSSFLHMPKVRNSSDSSVYTPAEDPLSSFSSKNLPTTVEKNQASSGSEDFSCTCETLKCS